MKKTWYYTGTSNASLILANENKIRVEGHFYSLWALRRYAKAHGADSVKLDRYGNTWKWANGSEAVA